jgi:hypothetical protein
MDKQVMFDTEHILRKTIGWIFNNILNKRGTWIAVNAWNGMVTE